MAIEKYDLVVIGSGPAGEKGAAKAAYFGKRVALIEKQPVLGGAAANTGTVPSKTLRETALFINGFRQRQLLGLDFRGIKDKVSVSDFLARERQVKDTERARVMENLRRHHVTLYMGTASFVDAHTVAIKPDRAPEFQIQGETVLIATGSYPYRPPEFPFHDPRICDSDTILSLHQVPQTMLVVGGGVIGCEYACMFAVMGVRVILVEKRDGILSFLDRDITQALEARMADMGMELCLSDSVDVVTQTGEDLKIHLHSGKSFNVQTVLVSSGRCGNTESLGLDKVGITANERGVIQVNDRFQTTVPNVYAAGDVVGNPALASTSMEQARAAITHAMQLGDLDSLAPILPAGIYTIPECSMAGESEESLKKKKVPYIIGKATYDKNARGQIIGDRHGFLKLLFSEDMKLLGVHILGEQATELVHVGLTAMMLQADVKHFIQTCYNYPTLTEIYKYAAYDALGRKERGQVEKAKAAR